MDDREKIRVLVVDDEKVVRDFLVRLLNLQSIEAKSAEDGFAAIEAVKNEKFDLVFLDIRMPKMDGLKAYAELKKIDPGLLAIFMTGYALEGNLLEETKQMGVICLKKPFQDIGQIKQIIENVLKEGENIKKAQSIMQNRRAYSRLAVSWEVDYKVKGVEEAYTRCLATNISPGGMKILFKDSLAVGKKIELIIKVQASNDICKATGEVIWAKEAVDKPGYFYIGLKFIEIDLSDLAVCIKQYNELSQQ